MLSTLRPLAWVPPKLTTFIYTVLLKPRPLRKAAQYCIKKCIPAELRIHGVDLMLNQNDAVVSGCLALGAFETYEVDFFKSLLKPGMAVLDVGSNIGLYASIAAAAVGPGGRVVAVEPNARNCELVRKTIERNKFTNLRLFQAAVSDHTGPGELYLCDDNMADHRIYGSHARRTVPVDFMRLDDIFAASELRTVDIMKMDIQGAEAIAFDGMDNVLSVNPRIRVLMEFWPWGIRQSGRDPAQLLAHIRRLGFVVREIDGDRKTLVVVTDDRELAGRGLERQHANLLLERPSAAG
jgi:FkbM family methyltransferase